MHADLRSLFRTISKEKEDYLIIHQARVCFYADCLAQAASPEVRSLALFAAAYHDVGKILIPDEVLFKAGSLSPDEWAELQLHPVWGADLLARDAQKTLWSPRDWSSILRAVRHHHERWDGAGYPDGLVGEDIPVLARIIAIADAYEAITADRPYRRAMTQEEALVELRKGAGTQFDPRLVEIFLKVLTEPQRY